MLATENQVNTQYNIGNAYHITYGVTGKASETYYDLNNLDGSKVQTSLFGPNGIMTVHTSATDNNDFIVYVYSGSGFHYGTLLAQATSSSGLITTGSSQYTNYYNVGVLNSQFGTLLTGAAAGNTWVSYQPA